MSHVHTESVLAWHFVADTLRNGYPVPGDGEPISVDEPVVLGVHGLHACRRVIDALRFAAGSTLCRVLCGGTVVEATHKLVASSRTILWRIDATGVLREFAKSCTDDDIEGDDAADMARAALNRAVPWRAFDPGRVAAAYDSLNVKLTDMIMSERGVV